MLQLAKLDRFAAWTSPTGLAAKSLLSDANAAGKDASSDSVASEQECAERSANSQRERQSAATPPPAIAHLCTSESCVFLAVVNVLLLLPSLSSIRKYMR
jgi:hypothetical protein